MVIRRRVVVNGQVQGVFFRDSARREAERLGLAGWVMNRRDGKVEAAFEGEAAAVDAAVAWCRRGPARAHVTDVEVREEPPERSPTRRFRVIGEE